MDTSAVSSDPDATFMRMKDDHMGNGQLKPAYDVQIAVNSEYITGIDAFSNRTDYGTLQPFLDKLSEKHGEKYQKVTADSGYESLDNYLYLEENGQLSFIKPQNYEQSKKRNTKLRSDVRKTCATMLSRIAISAQRGEGCLLFGNAAINTASGRAISATTSVRAVSAARSGLHAASPFGM